MAMITKTSVLNLEPELLKIHKQIFNLVHSMYYKVCKKHFNVSLLLSFIIKKLINCKDK